MKSEVHIIGAGISGLTAALRLRQKGYAVQVWEAGTRPGGLASGVSFSEVDFDGGPYIVLDRPGLEWAYQQLGLDLATRIPMQKIENIYQVSISGRRFQFYHSLQKTMQSLSHILPGSEGIYEDFVHQMKRRYDRLTPLQRRTHPVHQKSWLPPILKNLVALVRTGTWRDIGFLLSPLEKVFRNAKLPIELWPSLGIWTAIAGQKLSQAPSPLGMIPAISHFEGCFLPQKGLRQIPEDLFAQAQSAGVVFHFQKPVEQIECSDGRVHGLRLRNGQVIPATRIISSINGISTSTELVDGHSPFAQKLLQLPLQSPGFCIYLQCQGPRPEFYLNFRIENEVCQTFVCPDALKGNSDDRPWTARLIQPLAHGSPEALNPSIQQELIDKLLNADWWKAGLTDVKVLGTRRTSDWGREFHLYRDSMNPVMTAKYMRQGRIPHAHPEVTGLYMAGSSTHPGQWVSFAAISGILSADLLLNEARYD